ncbi:hypothetical protein Halru_1299 [Halovivax ruber XH-70]|uniref:Uncharacterized protein n=1 Tax=Halovivax ruber (strain DSM 18193 / JCM 13892 / XH-70) TaxID=797302 RepID=L0IAS0_HALRX|nr:hypothetical protein Halru_1299 [Halovivax ruber XH-70]
MNRRLGADRAIGWTHLSRWGSESGDRPIIRTDNLRMKLFTGEYFGGVNGY